MILKLGETGAIQIVIGSQVAKEIDQVMRRKAPVLLALMTLLLERSRVQIISDVNPEQLAQAQMLTTHAGDAAVLAEAWSAGVDYLVTHDREHFLENRPLRETTPFVIGTPGDFLAWYRVKVGGNASHFT